jgi:hypothetical protein
MITASAARQLITSNIHNIQYVMDRINNHVVSACGNGNHRINLSVDLPEYFSLANTGEYASADTTQFHQDVFDELHQLGYTTNIVSKYVSTTNESGKQVAVKQHHIIISW